MATTDLLRVYAADIVKSIEHDDGTVTIFGKAAGPDLDLDQQILDPSWLKSAMGSWYQRWGNIRESHDGHRAIGIATEYEPKDDDHFIGAKIVDPLAVAKVKAGILKGLSVGIKNPRVIKDASARGGRIISGTVVETSLVDHPANETCSITVMKAAGNDNTLVPVLDEGTQEADKGAEATGERTGLNADLAKVAEALGDVTKDASGHSHMHGHADGDHAHAHTHESSNYDHGDGEPHAHEHDDAAPGLSDAPADDSRAVAQAKDDQDALAAQKAGPTGTKDSDDRDGPSTTDDDSEGSDSAPSSAADGSDPDEDDRGTPAAYEDDGADDDDKKKAKAKDAEPEIRNVADLRDAITSAAGHGDAGSRRMIRKRASELGREDLLPDAWKASSAFRRIMAADAETLMGELSTRFGDKATGVDVTKAGEAEGVATARRALASLVMDEAAEMFAGTEDETACLDALLDALKCLRLFEMLEHAEGELTPVAGSDNTAALAAPEVEMATATDLVKMLTGDDAESATARDDIQKALGIDVDSLKAAVTEKILSDIEATKAVAEEGFEALRERLSKVEEMATPGGPSRARRPADAAKAAQSDRLRVEVDQYRRAASETLDSKLREGYSRLAAEASTRLASIEAA